MAKSNLCKSKAEKQLEFFSNGINTGLSLKSDMNKEEVAKRLGCSKYTVRNYMKHPETIPAIRFLQLMDMAGIRFEAVKIGGFDIDGTK